MTSRTVAAKIGAEYREISGAGHDLRTRFPAAKGYSPRNLKYMRAFAAAWPNQSIVQRSVAQLPWRHHVALLDKLKDVELRLWYAAAAVEHGWSRDVLALQIENGFHQRAGKAVTNFATTIEDERSDLAQQATRDPYMFDFLGTTDGWRERELEEKLVDHVGNSCSSSARASPSSGNRSGWRSAATSSSATCSSIT